MQSYLLMKRLSSFEAGVCALDALNKDICLKIVQAEQHAPGRGVVNGTQQFCIWKIGRQKIGEIKMENQTQRHLVTAQINLKQQTKTRNRSEYRQIGLGLLAARLA